MGIVVTASLETCAKAAMMFVFPPSRLTWGSTLPRACARARSALTRSASEPFRKLWFRGKVFLVLSRCDSFSVNDDDESALLVEELASTAMAARHAHRAIEAGAAGFLVDERMAGMKGRLERMWVYSL